MRLFSIFFLLFIFAEANPLVDQAYENYIQIHGNIPNESDRSFFDKYFWIFILGYFMIQKYFPSKKKNDKD
jgi:hypothetical protein